MRWIVRPIISFEFRSRALAGSTRDPKANYGYMNGQWDSESKSCIVNREEVRRQKIDQDKADGEGDSESIQAGETLAE